MKQNVLVVDDESQILAALKRTLRNQDFSLLTANDGNEALAILAETEVTLIISDYMMPGLSGTELLTKAEEMQPDSIRMILSGHSDFQDVMASMKAGTVHKFLAKPWSNNVLIDQINASLESKKTVVKKPVVQKGPSLSFYEIHTDLDDNITYVAPELEGIFGYKVDELEGQRFSILITERSYQQHLEHIKPKKDEEDSWKASAKSRIAQTKDNKPFPISLAVSKTAEKIVYFISVMTLNTAKNLQSSDVDSKTDDAYLLVTAEGGIQAFNQKFQDLFGDLVTPKVGGKLSDFLQDCFDNDFYPESQLNQDEWLENFLRFESPLECEFQNDQIVVITPSKNSDNSVQLVHSIQDLDIEKMLNKALEDAQKAVEEKKIVIERINTEISSPMLNSIMLPLEKLKETELEPIQQEQLDLVLKSGNDILSSLNDIAGKGSVNIDSK